MKNIKKTKIPIFVALVAFVAIGYFLYLDHQTKEVDEVQVTNNEVNNLLLKDLEKSYPATPRAVVKLYSEIITCFYKAEFTEKQLEELGRQARRMFDEQLLEDKTEEAYLNDLKEEIEDYKQRNRYIANFILDKSEDVKYFKVGKQECAGVKACYSVREDGKYIPTNEQFLLKKDKDGYWKICGWRLTADKPDSDDSE